MNTPELGLVVPMYGEGALVDRVVPAYLSALQDAVQHGVIVFVNNGSHDDTGPRLDAWTANSPHIHVLHLPKNRGYGGGILAGLEHLRAVGDPPLVAWAWGDAQVDPRVLPSLVRACRAGAHLAKVRRVSRHDGVQRRVITRVYARATAWLQLGSADVNGCPKVMRRSHFDAIAPASTDWFLDPELLLRAREHNWLVVELPVAMAARLAGVSKVRWSTVAGFAVQLAAWQLGWRPGPPTTARSSSSPAPRG